MTNLQVSDELQALLGEKIAKAFRSLELAVGRERQLSPEAITHLLQRCASWGPPTIAAKVCEALVAASSRPEKAPRTSGREPKPPAEFLVNPDYAERGAPIALEHGAKFLAALCVKTLTRDEAARALDISTSMISLMVHTLAAANQVEVKKRNRPGQRPVDEYHLVTESGSKANVVFSTPEKTDTLAALESAVPTTVEQWQTWVWHRRKGTGSFPLRFDRLSRLAAELFGQVPNWREIFADVTHCPADKSPTGKVLRVNFDEEMVD